jgi:hypothetical protein
MIHPHIFGVEFAFLTSTDKRIDEGVLGVCSTFERLVFSELVIVL